MEFDFSIFEKENELNETLRFKYEKLQQEERTLNGGSGRRITQVKIAKQVGISDSMISRWLKKERYLSRDIITKMAETLLIEEGLLNLRKEK